MTEPNVVDHKFVESVVDEIDNELRRLHWWGGRHFIVLSSAATGLAPAMRISGLGCVQTLSN